MIVHPVPAVGGTRRNAFKKAQHTADARIFERRQEVHFRRSRIGETDFKLLGHASVQTTERYLGTKQDLVNAPNDAIKLRVAV